MDVKTASMDDKTATMIDKTASMILVFQEGNDYTRGERGKYPVVTGIKTGCCRERDGMLLICPARGKLLRRAGQYLVACVRISCGGRQKT